jgi:tetratricopeptide (TPR) repeat protein
MVKLSKEQLSVIAVFSLLFTILYFGFDTKPKAHELIEKSRSLKSSSTDISILKKEAYGILDKSEQGRIDVLNAQMESAQDSTSIIVYTKELSGAWYQFGNATISGHYAERVAEMENNPDAWGIAATTYALGINMAKSEKEKGFCKERALKAFEVAISLAPREVRHQLNRAVTLAEHPDQNNPMKGIQLMLELNKSFPDNVSVLNQLAKFGMETNQLDKALERLSKAISIDPENELSNCLMAELQSRRNDQEAAEYYLNKCNNLRNTN